jgi:glycosyltransferase involved in cell wall biosynthesis
LDASAFERARATRGYDVCLYQMGNHAAHAYAYRALRRFPGITVLHDYVLHHLVVAMTAARGDEHAYVRELAYCHGRAGIDAARRAIASNHRFAYESFPANRRVIDLSFGVIVHSEYVRRLLEAIHPGKPIQVVPQIAVGRAAPGPPGWDRSSLGLADAVVFGSFGQIGPAKRIEVALRAFRKVHARLPRSRFLIVGEPTTGVDLDAVLDRLRLGDAVIRTGYLSKIEFLACIDLVDVGINLRWPVLGETSASLVRLLGAGKPTIVTGAGPFAEFPEAVCPKVPIGEDEEERLTEEMLRLAADSDLRRTMGEAARLYVRENHSPERCAQLYLEFVNKILPGGVSTS